LAPLMRSRTNGIAYYDRNFNRITHESGPATSPPGEIDSR
jgi:hypothetical protein